MPKVQALNYTSERSGHGHSRTRTRRRTWLFQKAADTDMTRTNHGHACPPISDTRLIGQYFESWILLISAGQSDNGKEISGGAGEFSNLVFWSNWVIKSPKSAHLLEDRPLSVKRPSSFRWTVYCRRTVQFRDRSVSTDRPRSIFWTVHFPPDSYYFH